jgi:hypothetical protein
VAKPATANKPLFVEPEDAHRRGQGSGILFWQRGPASKPANHRVDESSLARPEEGLVGKSSHYPSELLGLYFLTAVWAGARVVRTSGLIRIKDHDILWDSTGHVNRHLLLAAHVSGDGCLAPDGGAEARREKVRALGLRVPRSGTRSRKSIGEREGRHKREGTPHPPSMRMSRQ